MAVVRVARAGLRRWSGLLERRRVLRYDGGGTRVTDRQSAYSGGGQDAREQGHEGHAAEQERPEGD